MVGLGTSFGKIPDGQLKEFDGIREGIQMTRAAHCEFFWERPVEVCVTAPGYDGELDLSSLGHVSVLRKGRGEMGNWQHCYWQHSHNGNIWLMGTDPADHWLHERLANVANVIVLPVASSNFQ